MSQYMDEPGADPRIERIAPTVSARRGPSLLNALLGLALVVAVGGVAFAVGRMTAPATPTGFPNGVPGGGNFAGGPGASFAPGASFNPGNGPGGGLFGAGGVTLEGTVESVSGDTLTIRTADGQTVEVTMPEGTTYHSQASASSDEVTSGSNVLVRVDIQAGQGTGQLTASDVTIVPDPGQ
jgi:hypothetical protein